MAIVRRGLSAAEPPQLTSMQVKAVAWRPTVLQTASSYEATPLNSVIMLQVL